MENEPGWIGDGRLPGDDARPLVVGPGVELGEHAVPLHGLVVDDIVDVYLKKGTPACNEASQHARATAAGVTLTS